MTLTLSRDYELPESVGGDAGHQGVSGSEGQGRQTEAAGGPHDRKTRSVRKIQYSQNACQIS